MTSTTRTTARTTARTAARTTAAGVTGALVLALAAAPASASSAGTATVSVLHGVPGVTVDVYANGEELLPDFAPGTLTDPQSLPAGTYDLAIYPAGSDPASTQPAASAEDVAVPAGANATVVAHLTEDGTPVLTPFVNDTSGVPAGQARLVVRHTAAAPAVDVRAGGSPVITGLANPQEEAVEVPAGTVSADVVLAGTDTVAIGPADLDLAEGTSTIVYAWGSQEAGYQLATQTIGDLHSAPSGVPGGTAGLADDALPLPLAALAVLGLAGAGVAARRLATSRA